MDRGNIFSNHNIITRIKGSDKSAIINLLSGNADVLSPDKAEEIRTGSYSDIDEYVAKGYIVNENTEKERYNEVYLDFLDARDESEIQLFYVPWYACNFACSYCYQSGYDNAAGAFDDRAVVDAFFGYVSRKFGDRKKYVTLFGGEPLLPGKRHEESVSYLLEKASDAGLDVAIVTNGYHVKRYMRAIEGKRIREIQVTLDGTRDVHDRRRPLAGGGGTFDEIVSGIDELLSAGIKVNLRLVLDEENIGDLPGFARFAIEKGWTGNPLVKTQAGRNYELHFCRNENAKLLTRLGMYERIYGLSKTNPEIRELLSPSFSVIKHLYENGKLPLPLFDSCPACKTEWAFDYTGSVYPCTATVGKADERIGSFYPREELDEERINVWQSRDVTAIPECRGCSYGLACGGGCGSVAKNKNGSILSKDCRPVAELMGLGLSYYFGESVKEEA